MLSWFKWWTIAWGCMFTLASLSVVLPLFSRRGRG